MIAEATQVTIRAVPFASILDDPAFPDLLEAYKEDCSAPNAGPQRGIYEAMEKAGLLHCFAAYAGDLLVGFVSLMTVGMPHGNRMTTGESIFVDPEYRGTGAGEALISAAEEYVDAIGTDLSWLPRIGSAFDKVLGRRRGYTPTHTQHTRWLK